MNIHLLAIDPQNDFCDLPDAWCPVLNGQRLAPALPVPGAHEDMVRLAGLIQSLGSHLTDITVTLDSHPNLAIERPSLWRDADNQPVPAFTVVTHADVLSGRYRPRFEADLVASQIARLESQGGQLMVWPEHCVTGTWGHTLHPQMTQALSEWECRHGRTALKVRKGDYPWSEHYGVFVADTPLDDVPSTQFNLHLARRVTRQVDVLLVGGEASSHCVRASIEQLLTAMESGRIPHMADAARVILLSDCMSPVPGFEQTERDFIEQALARGVHRMTATQALSTLSIS